MHPPILLFDFDGVILTQRGLEYTALLQLRKKFYNWQNTEKMRLIDFTLLFERSDSSSRLKSLLRIYRIYSFFIPRIWKRTLFFLGFSRDYSRFEKIYDTLKPGLEAVLIKLREKGIPLAIISNTEKRRLKYFKHKLQLKKYFSFFITRDDVPINKPHPYPLLIALKKIKQEFNFKSIEKSNVYFIGDLPTDVKCAKSAGVNSIALLSGHGTEKSLTRSNPTFILEDIKDLLNLECFKKLLLE